MSVNCAGRSHSAIKPRQSTYSEYPREDSRTVSRKDFAAQ
jgi:hypothetical protein